MPDADQRSAHVYPAPGSPVMMEFPRPPASAVSWMTLLGLVLAVLAGGIGYGTLVAKVDALAAMNARVTVLELDGTRREVRLQALEQYPPISVDRRLGAIEAKIDGVLRQLREGEGRRPRGQPGYPDSL